MRINVVPVSELMDQHLVAEYREIKMLPKMLCRSLMSKRSVDLSTLPEEYTLNKGHGKFFYDKLLFIEKRFEQILAEMGKRGFVTNSTELYMKDYDYGILYNLDGKIAERFRGDYLPTYKALVINRERIRLRISEIDGFYRYYGKLIGG